MKRTLLYLLVVCGLVIGLLRTSPVSAEDATPPEPGDLLYVEDFNAAYSDALQRVANGWFTWSLPHLCRVEGGNSCGTPEYKQASPLNAYPDRVRGGSGNAQQWHTFYQGHYAGIARQLQVPPFAEIEIGAWALTWSSSEDDPHAASAPTRMRIGVDPMGGVDASSPDVIWGDESDPPNGQFSELKTLVARNNGSPYLTIYIAADPQYPVKHNDIYVDDVWVRYLRTVTPSVPEADGGSDMFAMAGSMGLASAAAAPDPILNGLLVNASPAATGGGSVLMAALSVGLLALLMNTTRKRQGGKR